MPVASSLVPRPQVHHRFGKKRADIGIITVRIPNPAHRASVGTIQRTAILGLRICIAITERIDERVLYYRRVWRVFLGKSEFLPSEFGRRLRYVWEVDVRPARKRDAPMRHGAGRINLLRRSECSNCGAVIEAEEEVETLVEVFLRLGSLW